MKKNYINPYTVDYAWGGALSGGLSQGASLASAGMAFGPVGAAIGGAAGLIMGGIQGSKQEDAANEQQRQIEEAKARQAQSNYDAQVGGQRVNAYAESMNQPVRTDFYEGGQMGNGAKTDLINPTDVNYFDEGGSHETNPHGGIPQGMADNGKMNTVEEGEVSIKMDKDTKYIFSDRLTYV